MATIPAQAFLYPTIYPTFAKFRDFVPGTYAGDPRIASDHAALWKVLLAWEFTMGLQPAGRWTTVAGRIRNGMKIQGLIVSATAAQWASGVLVDWNALTTGPLFTGPPMVCCTFRGADPANNNSPFRFWVGGVISGGAVDPLGAASTIRARAKDGSGLTGGTVYTVSVIGIGLAATPE